MPATYMQATIEELFSIWSMPRCYNWEVWSLVESSVQASVKRTKPEAEE
jgi:hypothetical protein